MKKKKQRKKLNMSKSKHQVKITNILDRFNECTKNATSFLSAQPNLENELKSLIKLEYDFTKTFDDKAAKTFGTLSKLIVTEFDEEQVWQQIQTQNEVCLHDLKNILEGFSLDEALSEDSEEDDDNNNSGSEVESDVDGSDENEDFELDSEDEGVDEEDFEEGEDETEIDMDESENEESKDEEIDEEYGSITDEDESIPTNEKQQGKKRVRFSEDTKMNSDSEEEDNDIVKKTNDSSLKSTLEYRQLNLNKRVKDLEEEALKEKPWTMKGEVSAKDRDPGVILEEYLEVDVSRTKAPEITVEASQKLEDIILQRIKDAAWDDVEKKIKPTDTPHEFKKKLVLDQEKSKLSLPQIYEQEYLKQKDAADPSNKFNLEEEPREHTHIKNLMNTLFAKLDTLSNYHYTPIPIAPELQIVSNVPAISMEEAIPAAVSDSVQLAPEEVQDNKKGIQLISKAERTDTDKNRARRKKKSIQKRRAKEIKQKMEYLEKVNPSKNNKHSRMKIQKDLEKLQKSANVSHFKESGSDLKSSKMFFDQMQDVSNMDRKAKLLKRKSNNDTKFTTKRTKS